MKKIVFVCYRGKTQSSASDPDDLRWLSTLATTLESHLAGCRDAHIITATAQRAIDCSLKLASLVQMSYFGRSVALHSDHGRRGPETGLTVIGRHLSKTEVLILMTDVNLGGTLATLFCEKTLLMKLDPVTLAAGDACVIDCEERRVDFIRPRPQVLTDPAFSG